jgi:hypothetical protein
MPLELLPSWPRSSLNSALPSRAPDSQRLCKRVHEQRANLAGSSLRHPDIVIIRFWLKDCVILFLFTEHLPETLASALWGLLWRRAVFGTPSYHLPAAVGSIALCPSFLLFAFVTHHMLRWRSYPSLTRTCLCRGLQTIAEDYPIVQGQVLEAVDLDTIERYDDIECVVLVCPFTVLFMLRC